MLIERQPLYVKGVKQVKGYPGTRYGMHWASESDSKGSSQVAWGYRGSAEYYEKPVNYKMRDESANAFKAAAAYFLTMVLSLIYAQNHHGINAAVLPCITQLPVWIYNSSKSVYLRYRRRHYVDIPDTGNVLPMTHRYMDVGDGISIERNRTFELLRRQVVEMSMKISHITPKRRRRDLKTKNV
uniref:Uncharacterized protein n=2 Tax=Odontella aurita TaxID=265563 RepID=A0A7S4I8A3_9STRA|mmetsp:Transcript_21139/g.61492  ORF Transcript_21139/g.61492 Transcript_21139/m.61492 type:complete len:184 (+) Transcript_21139:351-902(+)